MISPQVRLVRLVGIMLIIYVKASHYQHVRNIEDQEVATGILGYFGNLNGHTAEQFRSPWATLAIQWSEGRPKRLNRTERRRAPNVTHNVV